MLTFAKAASTFVMPALLASGILASGDASAQNAPAAQPCTGTLCDLYYGGSGSAATPATSASPSATQQGVPVTVPTGNIFSGLFSGGTQAAPGATAPNAQPASTPFVRVVGGRPAGERCTGTFCDLYYGGSDAPAPAPASPVGQQQASASSVVSATDPGVAPGPVREHVAAPQPKPICHNDRDPWQCYR